jgi:hypothetical protein
LTIHLGDVPAGTTLYIPFATYGSSGQSLTMSGLAVTDIEIYKNGSTTQRASDTGYTLLDTDGIDFDGITGIHGFSIDLSSDADAGFFSVGGFYWVIVSSVTVNSQTVNFIAATFRICAAEAVTGKPKVDVDAWLGTAAATPTVAGVPEVDVTHFGGTAGDFSVAGVPAANVTHLNNSSTAGTNFGRWMATGDNGTADSGTTTTLTDTSLDGSDDNNYVGYNLYISSGTNSRMMPRRITAFDNVANQITFEPAYPAAIDTTSVYTIIPPFLADVRAWQGTTVETPVTAGRPSVDAQAIDGDTNAAFNLGEYWGVVQEVDGGSTASTWTTTTCSNAELTAADTDHFVGSTLMIQSGTYAGLARVITAFDPTTDTITFDPALPGSPATTVDFMILPLLSAGGSGSGPSAATIADAVWDEARAGHVTAGSFGEYVLADTVKISGDTTAADNAEAMFDGTGYAGGTIKLGVDAVAISGSTTAADNAEIVFATDFASNYDTTRDVWKAEVTHWIDTAVATPTVAGVPEVDLTHISGSAVSATTAQLGVNVVNLNNNLLSVQRLQAIMSATLSATADSGTTTTIVDAARTESNVDHWKDSYILIASGSMNGLCRRITAFDPATDTITFTPALPSAVSTETYLILPNTTQNVGAIIDNAITAASLAADAGTEIGTAVWASVARTLTALDEDNTTLDLDATIRSAVGLAAANLDTQLTAIDDLVDTEVAAIKTVVDAIQAKTDNLPSDPADASVIAGRFDTIDTNLATVDTVADAIKAKTDNLPSDPADASVVAGLIAAVETKVDTVDTVVDAVKAKTDSLTFTQAGHVDANIQRVNDVLIAGTGVEDTDEWRPA